MNIYEVTFSCKRHYGNGHFEREDETPLRVSAKNGEAAVTKARKKVESTEPCLEGLKRVLEGVN